MESAMQNGVEFNDFPFTMTKDLDLSALNSIPAHVRAVVHRTRRSFVPATEEDNKFKSSIKARIRGKETLLEVMKFDAVERKVYSSMKLIPAKKSIIDTVQPANMPLS